MQPESLSNNIIIVHFAHLHRIPLSAGWIDVTTQLVNYIGRELWYGTFLKRPVLSCHMKDEINNTIKLISLIKPAQYSVHISNWIWNCLLTASRYLLPSNNYFKCNYAGVHVRRVIGVHYVCTDMCPAGGAAWRNCPIVAVAVQFNCNKETFIHHTYIYTHIHTYV